MTTVKFGIGVVALSAASVVLSADGGDRSRVPPIPADPAAQTFESVRRDIRTSLESTLSKGGTSASYAVLQHGRLIVADAVGYLDASKRVAATTETLYNIGSVSKVVTAAAVMHLVDERRVSLDDTVVQHLPEFKLKDPRYTDITVRMLLNHSSGMLGTNYVAGSSYGAYDTQFPQKSSEYFAASVLKADPGMFSVYCNDGFEVAERLVARVSGQPFDRYVADHIFAPLRMDSAGYAMRPFLPGSFAVKGSYPHEFQNVMGSGGVVTTPSDLVRFGYDFLRAAPVVLRAASAREMSRPQGVTIIPDDTVGTIFALGWDAAGKRFGDYDFGTGVLDKAGGTSQFSSQLYVIPKYNLVGAITVSDDFAGDGPSTLREILARVLRAEGFETARPKRVATTPAAKPLPPDFERVFAGYYASNGSLLQVAVNADATLTILRYDGEGFSRVVDGLVYDGQDFLNSAGEKSYRLVSSAGRQYVMGIDEGQNMYNAMAQRIESRAAPLGAWEKRLGRLYLPAEVAREAVYVVSGFALSRYQGLEGLLFMQSSGGGMAVTAPADDTHTVPTLLIPGLNGRDLCTLTIEIVNGEEWLARPDYRLRPAASLPLLAGGSLAIPSSGENLLYRLPPNKVTFTVPDKGRVIAYDTSGTNVYDSLSKGVDPSLLPATGFIRFVGPPGTTFDVTVAPVWGIAGRISQS